MRLIDADKIGLTDFEIVMCQGDYKEAFKMLINKIDNLPTAYDVDREGGVDNNVCMWRKEGSVLYTSCCDRFNAYAEDFKYCPYCGKKIEVIE